MSYISNKKWFNGLDSLRIILAITVLLSHFDNVYADMLKQSPHLLFHALGFFLANAFDGTAAVIAFFIISGFVIHYPNKNGIISLKDFWMKRFVRIIIPLSIIWVAGIRYNHPENAVIWSLICELIYYAIYPFIYKVNLSWTNKVIIAYLISTVVIILGAHDDFYAFFKQTDLNYQGYYWQLGYSLTWLVGLPCWLLGVLLAEHIDSLNSASFRSVMTYRCLVFALGCFCCIAKFHMHLSYIISMNLISFVLYKWLQTEIVYFKTRPANNILEKMGKFSYSLYICHPLIYLLLKSYLPNNALTYPLFIILAIVISYCFYLLIEKPAHQFAQRAIKKYSFQPR
ncbi:acyltransferase family protein [Mucilaginibacter sp. McL0603]|uniref:acyltransferase family protein n=1 Tax=Mucilaginibacter sp. McL0603 TaxID=3415670 RepID=UPI003CEBACD4